MDVFTAVISVAGIVIASVALGVQLASGSRPNGPKNGSKGDETE